MSDVKSRLSALQILAMAGVDIDALLPRRPPKTPDELGKEAAERILAAAEKRSRKRAKKKDQQR